ncbi:MAG: pseudouridine synthase, partial [Kiritimatiellales bacterium]
IALLDGEVSGNEGTIELPFRLDVENRPYQIYDPVNGKTGVTHWKVLSTDNKKTRVEFIPVTGRTHQLRVHAASKHGLGVPILGDRLYGSGTAPGQLKLHASFLSFTHPRTGERLEFRSAPPF